MLNWLANAIATRIERRDAAAVKTALQEISAEGERQRRQAREIIGEMEDMLEKFSRVVAREAMRRSREAKAAMDLNPQTAAAVDPVEPAPMSAKDRKALLRQRLITQVRGARAASDE